MAKQIDAIVVGSGPNGLSAAIEIARSGYGVCVYEAKPTVGGGMRTLESTLPGFLHDHCSAVHPLGILSPFFQQLPLEKHGLEWLATAASVAHPMDHDPAVMLYQDLEQTASELGADASRWRKMMSPFLAHPHDLLHDLLGPLRANVRRPGLMARFGLQAAWPARRFAKTFFREPRTQALFAGCAGHSILPLDHLLTAALGLIFSICGHLQNWPVARGGSQAIANALAAHLKELGGTIHCNTPVNNLRDLPPARSILLDLAPSSVLRVAGEALPLGYRKRLRRFKYGPGVFKLDWALSEQIPWQDSNVDKATTVHVGGTLDEIAASEAAAWHGRQTEHPFLILCQQSHADHSRAPQGQHTGYAYCHVPSGCDTDMTTVIENQIERFAPGFRDVILARHVTRPTDLEADNPNYVGGAVTGGAANLTQLFTRPVARLNPYTTPNPAIYLCSASTPPGGGVHGMCGFHAARSVIRKLEKGAI